MANTRTATARASSSRAAPNRRANRPSRTSLARQSKPTASLYVDDSSDDSDAANDSDSSVHSVRDVSDDDDTDSGIDAFDEDVKTSTPSRKRKRATSKPQPRPRTPRNAMSTPRKAKSTPQKRRKATPKPSAKKQRSRRSQAHLQTPTSKSKKATGSVAQIPTGIIPNWCDGRIPYQAWVDIFLYASDNGDETGWLLHMARTCKAFFEPALAALYQNLDPPSAAKTKKLVALLELPPETTLVSYRSKVKALWVDLETFPLGMLHDIVRPLHRMKELIIFSKLDQPPYRELDKTIRWSYPRELFAALDPQSVAPVEGAPLDSSSPTIVLKNWEWSSRMLGGYVCGNEDISRIHQLPSFASLTRLSFTNFQIPSLHKTVRPNDEEGLEQLYQEDARAIDSIADAISQLQHLKHLVFESSTIMNDRLLPQLPKGLVHLGLINCWEVKSEDLTDFLHTHGRYMRALTLSHNQSLDLAFLTDLAVTCPELRELRMNLSYYRHHESVNDADPMYDQALLPHQVPMWPSSLRLLEIEQVRHWTREAAEMLLQSLVDSAPRLLQLRYLAIKTILNIPVGERAKLRNYWHPTLEKIFLRPYTPPNVHTTLRPQATAVDSAPAPSPVKKHKKRKEDTTPSRRSGRIAAHVSDSDGGGPHRLRNSGRPQYRDPDTDEDEESSDDDFSDHASDVSESKMKIRGEQPDDGDGAPDSSESTFIQGLCDYVSIQFDNQKPREVQYTMDDFNDDEDVSSEESWNGDDYDPDD